MIAKLRYLLPIIIILVTVITFTFAYIYEVQYLNHPILYLLAIFVALLLAIYNYFDARRKNLAKTIRIMNIIFSFVAVALIIFAVSVFVSAVQSGV